jgi:uncharacterized protein (TIGR02391 family)
MSLSTNIDPRLWASLQNAYEAENFTSAILDSIHFLSELIRNKSGLDSDGHILVGAAFGGHNPIIKVNALHTESQKDEQRGTEFLLRGLYTAIRNPRSHEKRTNTCEVADVIISFVNYLVGVIDKSRSPFDKEDIVGRVFDRHFVHTDQYADLIVARIPQRKRLEVLIEVFERRAAGNSKSVVFFVRAVLRALNEEERGIFYKIVSEALESASSDAEFRAAIHIAQHAWLRVSEIARLRTENRLIQSIREGEYDSFRGVCLKGSLGTWVGQYCIGLYPSTGTCHGHRFKASRRRSRRKSLFIELLHGHTGET